MRCLCIDDEPLALNQICEYVKQVPFLELAGRASDAFGAMEILAKEHVDLIFTDINMPDLNGLEFVKALDRRPLVIFTTAYSEYAVEGFKVDALDYLLKPFSFADLLKSANKALKQLSLEHEARTLTSDSQPFMYVKADGKAMRINYSEIDYVEGKSEYVRIYLESAKPIMTLLSLKLMEEHLPQQSFMRIHRSYIVNIHKVKQASGNHVLLCGGQELPIGDQYRDSFNSFLQRYFLSK